MSVAVFDPGDVVLADCGFCGYATFLLLARRGVDCVTRNHHRRTVGISKIKRLGKGDRLIQWHKSRKGPKWLDNDVWQAMPKRITLREICFRIEIPGFRTDTLTVATTLLDPGAFPTEAFGDLYRRRWMAELFLRDISRNAPIEITTKNRDCSIITEFFLDFRPAMNDDPRDNPVSGNRRHARAW